MYPVKHFPACTQNHYRSIAHSTNVINKIPFAVTAQEVSQFIQRFSANPTIEKHVSGYPLHIIMEKPTGKTMDCFIEFPSSATAAECVQRFDESNMRNRHRLGARHVSLDLSSQAELMSSLFPRARSVKWDHHTGQPVLQQQPSASFPADGFRGYFTLEEIFGLVKFAETPSRVSTQLPVKFGHADDTAVAICSKVPSASL